MEVETIKTKQNMKKLFIIILMFMTGCTERGCQRWNKNHQYSDRHYHVKQYSGGVCVGEYDFKGIINDSEGSDGYYFFRGDTLIEVSGDLSIKSWD
jgi:hypothetical protein